MPITRFFWMSDRSIYVAAREDMQRIWNQGPPENPTRFSVLELSDRLELNCDKAVICLTVA